jgi:hypothetical protein
MRTGSEWAANRIAVLVRHGLRLLAETEGGDSEDLHLSLDEEED